MEAFEIVGTQLHITVTMWIVIGSLLITAACVALYYFSGLEFLADLVGILAGVIGAIALVFWLIMLMPFDGKYHQLYRVTTNVESVTNSFVSGSGELTSKPVMQLEGIDRPVTSNDPRVLTLEGKNITFTCAIGWNYQAADTYSCSIYSINQEGAN